MTITICDNQPFVNAARVWAAAAGAVARPHVPDAIDYLLARGWDRWEPETDADVRRLLSAAEKIADARYEYDESVGPSPRTAEVVDLPCVGTALVWQTSVRLTLKRMGGPGSWWEVALDRPHATREFAGASMLRKLGGG